MMSLGGAKQIATMHGWRLVKNWQLTSRNDMQSTPAARLMILAHSHGGTVSLYAMQKLSGVDYVSDLFLMNTPFLDCQKRDPS